MESKSQYINLPGFMMFKVRLKKLADKELTASDDEIKSRTLDMMKRWNCKTCDEVLEQLKNDDRKLREFIFPLTARKAAAAPKPSGLGTAKPSGLRTATRTLTTTPLTSKSTPLTSVKKPTEIITPSPSSSEDKSRYDSPEYTTFKMKLRKLIGVDLSSYKEQIHRRTHELMQRWGCKTYDEYFDRISGSEVKLREFLDHLTINVSEFFRNKEQWWKLRDQIIPELIKKRGSKRLKLWSAGCATGEEPYSLAILSAVCGLDMMNPVLAADYDRGAVETAKRGHYRKTQLLNAPPEYLNKYFTTRDGGETYDINAEIKRRVKFELFNMIDDSFGSNFDLILCRNVVIYFTSETKDKLYRKFFDALAPGGYFLVGSTEQIYGYQQMGFISAGPFLYTKK